MRHLITVLALALSACGGAESTVTAGATSQVDASSSTNVTNSVTSSNSSSVTSSSNVGSTSSTTSSSASGTTQCSSEHNGKRCEISCNAPQTAQCRKSITASEPSCLCR